MPNTSPFNWQGTPSIFTKSHDHNGVNSSKADRATRTKKTPFVINGRDPRTPHNQVNVYGRAVVAKPQEKQIGQ
jgi:hypothetical protein